MPTQKELYILTKEMLFAKFNGKCALCGYELGDRWHIWHIEPNKTIVTEKKVIIANESYENKLPSCVSCHSTKTNFCQHGSIEDFRKVLYHEFVFLKETSTYYRKMIRYDVIRETGNPIVFYFEKMTKK